MLNAELLTSLFVCSSFLIHKPPLGGLGVKNRKDYAPSGRVILYGVLNKEKALPRLRNQWKYFTRHIHKLNRIKAPLGGLGVKNMED
jgi:hypothetical protein